MSKFKVGDRVKVIKDIYGKCLEGLYGTVVKNNTTKPDITSVEFDSHIDGHSCLGSAKEGYGYNLDTAHLELIEPQVYSLEDLKEGRVAMINDSSINDLRKVLAYAFPNDKSSHNMAGVNKFYARCKNEVELWHGCKTIGLPKQSVKEFIKQIDMKEEKKDERFPFELSLSDAMKITAIACSEWKTKLSEKWGGQILRKGFVSVGESFYKEMRQECNNQQHEVFDKIFGKDEIECPYEDGELIFVRDSPDREWLLRYSNGEYSPTGATMAYNDQTKSGSTTRWRESAKATGIKLPE